MIRRIFANLVSPSSGTRFPALDGLRGLACLGVLICHMSDSMRLSSLGLRLGCISVSIFFALSAFLLFYPWAKAGAVKGIAGYYRRRLWRIYPANLFAVAFAVLVALVIGSRFNWQSILANFAFLQTLFIYKIPSINTAVWSMTSEILFYLVLPLLAWLVLRHKVPMLLTLAILFAIFFVLIRPNVILYANFPGTGMPFLAGMAVALMVAGKSRMNRFGLSPILLLGLFLAMDYLSPVPLPGHVAGIQASAEKFTWLPILFFSNFGMLSSLIAGLAVLAMATDKSVFTKIGNFNYLRCFGVCSYGAFLFHFPIYMLLQSYNPLLRPTLGLPLAIAAGYLSYTFVEAPSMRRASQRAKLLLLRQSPIPDPIREK